MLFQDEHLATCLGQDGSRGQPSDPRTDHNRVDIFWQLALGKALLEHFVTFLLVVDIRLPRLATVLLERVWYIAL